MQTVELAVEARTDTGKGAARRLRQAGRVPVVLYGRDTESCTLSLLEADFVAGMQSAMGRNTIFTLKADGELGGKLAMAREIQKSPVYRELLHVDLYQIGADRPLEIEIPVVLVGEPLGVTEGGILFQSRRYITVRCSPDDLPSFVQVDVSSLEIGHRTLVSEIELPDAVELVHRNEFAICVVKPPRGVEEETVETEELEDGEEAEGAEAEEADAEDKE